MKALELLKDKLEKLKKKQYKSKYYLPSLWVENKVGEDIEVNPFSFYYELVSNILESQVKPKNKNEKVVYNLFPRYATSYDHNKDSLLENNDNQFRETGTFLKCIAMLPYLQFLGVDIIYLLPINSIGFDNRKGNAGSPYAIKNHFELDANLGETILELDVELQYKAFVEAAHQFGFKVINEFIFRTASVDSDLALTKPDWFYWIKASIKDRDENNDSEARYGSPYFTKKELIEIKDKVSRGDFENTVAPHEQFRKMFLQAPTKAARVEGKILAVNPKKEEVRIPSAFADWPPDDKQPSWSDVTYLRLYDHPDFNYIAYNTVRMYDKKLAKNKNKVQTLWEYLESIIPYYIDNYGIDGVMIDMGHALPSDLLNSIIKKAKAIKQDFIFWEENFSLTQSSLETGYNAVLGYACFDEKDTVKLKSLVSIFGSDDYHLPDFFATSETHNTKRAMANFGSTKYSLFTYCFNALLPTLTFIHNGFELCETTPVNTGLGFTEEEISQYTPNDLPLFATMQMNWQEENTIFKSISDFNSYLNSIEFIDKRLSSLELGEKVVSFSRKAKDCTVYFIGTIEETIEHIDLKLIGDNLFDIYGNKAEGITTLTQFDSLILIQRESLL